MHISDAIRLLTELKNKHGDLELKREDGGSKETVYMDVEGITADIEHDPPEFVEVW